jgi:hypothetical protein
MQASSVQEPEPAKGCCGSSRPPYDAPSLDHVQIQRLPIRPVNNLSALSTTGGNRRAPLRFPFVAGGNEPTET